MINFRNLAAALEDEQVKPLRTMNETQTRVRKSVEAMVDKTARLLTDWRNAEAKSKKMSFVVTKDHERLHQQLSDGSRTRRFSDKDFSKVKKLYIFV